eukprot:gene2938-576_t
MVVHRQWHGAASSPAKRCAMGAGASTDYNLAIQTHLQQQAQLLKQLNSVVEQQKIKVAELRGTNSLAMAITAGSLQSPGGTTHPENPFVEYAPSSPGPNKAAPPSGGGVMKSAGPRRGGASRGGDEMRHSAASTGPEFWAELARKMPVGKNAADKAVRAKLFRQFDPNGNGYLSLAEIDKGIRDHLDCDEIYDCKKPIMRAFQAAKGIGKTKARLGPDFVEKCEFRLLLVYLRQYFELFVMFDRIDSGHYKDQRIDIDEFKAGIPLVEKWGFRVTNPDAEFSRIDRNGGGQILFDEFADWALKKSLDLEDDDSDDDYEVTIQSTFSANNMGGGSPRPNKATPQRGGGYDTPNRPNKAAPPTRGGGRSPANQYDKEYTNVTINPAADTKIWGELARKLPTKRNDADKATRVKLFNQFDPNGNGYLSLAEVDKGIRDVLQCHQMFGCKAVIMRAFQAAKGAGKTKSRLGPDFVEKCEFRLLLVYLRQYFELFVMFSRIDSSDAKYNDQRVDLNEFKAAVPLFKAWGYQMADPETEFRQVDKNGGGHILFDEFAEWAFKKELDLEDDDDF